MVIKDIMQNFDEKKIGLKILIIARKCMKKIFKKSRPIFTKDIINQKKFLNNLPEPNNLIERSYFQYLCQMQQMNFFLKIGLNSVSILLFPIYWFKYSNQYDYSTRNDKEKRAVFFDGGETINIIPISLQKEYYEIKTSTYNDMILIGIQEKRFIKKIIKKYKFKPYFFTKCMLKIGLYAYSIRKYNPKAIITCSEDSFTVSVLTEYCRTLGIEHINVMHGEKLFNIRDSFVQFDRYYVWDQYYANLLTELCAAKNQFIIEMPNQIQLDVRSNDLFKYQYTYYLGAENKKELFKIKENLTKLKVPNNKICIRYHPRYSTIEQITDIFKEFNIENPLSTDLNISIAQSKYIISLYSTVLYQAYKSGKEIIIDDVTDPGKYMKLKELKYIMINKPHIRLSEIIDIK